MSAPVSNVEKKRKLPWALGGDAANIVYVYLAFSGPVFLLFLDTIGLDKSRIGLVLSTIPFCGLISIFITRYIARVGYKRTYLTFWTIRKFILALVMACPWVIHQYGTEVCFYFVAIVIGIFSLCRGVAAAACSAWSSEFVPNAIRGKYASFQQVLLMLVGALVVSLAGRFIGEDPEPSRFIGLFAVAFVFGLLSVWSYTHVEGGGPQPPADEKDKSSESIFTPLKDKGFRQFLMGGACVTLGTLPLMSFLPLFMKEEVGLTEGQVIGIEAMQMIGGLTTSFFWGWVVDRYGGRPVMVTAMLCLIVFPVGLLLLPQDPNAARTMASVLYFFYGAFMPAWTIGYGKYFYGRMVPDKGRTAYVSVHWAVVGVMGGLCPIMAGYVLQYSADLHGGYGFLNIHPYTPLILFFIFGTVCGAIVMSRAPRDSPMDASRFVMMFLQGSPVSALQALFSHQFAGYEVKRVASIEKLGTSKSPLSIKELIEALDDPSFNVRYEAIVSIARGRQDRKLTKALIKVLREADPDLRTTAAWALGRTGATESADALREMLGSMYPLIRARSARALGTLGDTDSIPAILEQYDNEPDDGIKVAYAAALASLGHTDSIDRLLKLLAESEDKAARAETSLAIATLVGGNEQALRLWRRMVTEPGDTLGGVLLGMGRKTQNLAKTDPSWAAVAGDIGKCASQCGNNNFEEAARTMQRITENLPANQMTPIAYKVLTAAATALAKGDDMDDPDNDELDELANEFSMGGVDGDVNEETQPEAERQGVDEIRIEYLCLTVHALHMGLVTG